MHRSEGHFTPKRPRTIFAKNHFAFKKHPPKIRKNPFVPLQARTHFGTSEMPRTQEPIRN